MENRNIENDVQRVIEHVDLTPMADKTVLITGATGLIGTYILYTLSEYIKQGHNIEQVYAITMNGFPEHLKKLEHEKWMTVLKGDLTDDSFIDTLPKADIIIHAAGYGQPAKFVIDETKTLKLNTYLTFKLFDKLKPNGKYLFVSSSGIYNGLEKETFMETDVGTTNTLHPRACYIEGKRCGEAICNAYRKKGVEAKAARVSYSYGPGVRSTDERALYAFIRKGLNGEIRLLDDGSAQRIYCYITDVVEMLLNILLYGKEPIYNVGGRQEISIYDLATIIANELNVKVIIPDVENSVSGNAKAERISIEKYEKEFGKMDFVSIQDGVTRTINWMKETY